MNRSSLGLVVLLLVQILSSGFGQEQPDMQRYLDMIQRGQADLVKVELPNLISRYPRHPGIIFLQGMLTTDGAEAAKIFQSVADNFPNSEWADDALYKVYQFYYSLGLYKTASEKFTELKNKHPQSEYVTGKKETAVVAGTPETAQTAGGPIQPESRPQPTATQPKPMSTSSAYSVQVGAFKETENAASVKNFFEGEGYSVELRNKVRDGQSLHAVWIGSFATLEEARKFSQDLLAKYKVDSFVVAR